MNTPRLKVLSLCGTFPNPSEPGLGLFSRARLNALAAFAEVKVIAPVAPLDYDNPARAGIGPRSVPRRREDGRMEVFHPAALHLPGNVALNGILLALSLLPTVTSLRRSFPFDVIDAHFAHPEGVAGWLLAKLFDRPYVVRLHGNELANSVHPVRRRAMARAVQDASKVIAVSDQLCDLAVSLGARKQEIRVIPNGVDASVFHPRERQRQRRPLILSAGRLVEGKRHHEVIEALGILRQRNVEAELVIAGGAGRGLPSNERDLRERIARLGLQDSVKLLGWVPQQQLAGWMSAADVFCLASEREGCPNVVIEAMACGTPVVATDVGMVCQLVEPDRTGFVTPPGDLPQLADALAHALEREWNREQIAASGQARSWSKVGEETWEQLLAATDSRRP